MESQSFLFALLCALFPTGLAAQNRLVRATIDSGSLIRMYQHSGTPLLGRLIQPLTPATIEIHTCRYRLRHAPPRRTRLLINGFRLRR